MRGRIVLILLAATLIRSIYIARRITNVPISRHNAVISNEAELPKQVSNHFHSKVTVSNQTGTTQTTETSSESTRPTSLPTNNAHNNAHNNIQTNATTDETVRVPNIDYNYTFIRHHVDYKTKYPLPDYMES